MTSLLATLNAAGIALTADGKKLRYTAPAGALTPALRAEIAEHRADLLALLAAETMPESRQDGPHATMPATEQPQPTDTGLGHPDDVRTAALYHCWKPGCDGVASGLWQQIGPDCWQGECDGGHSIQRSSTSFTEPPEVTHSRPVALPANLPAGPLPLWCYDRVHGITPPAPAPAGHSPEQIATEVAAARADWERLVHPVPVRFRPKPHPYRDAALVARILDAGERLGWPALPLRPGERLAAGRTCWETFVKAAPANRLVDAERLTLGLVQ